jgi:hypothetical protein
MTEFKWFFGVVVDRNDPQQLGRVRIKVQQFHDNDNSQELPNEMLPWATPIVPIISASISKGQKKEIGLAPVGPIEGTTVFGFFADGSIGRKPFYFGSMFGIPDNDQKKHEVPSEARGINSINKVYESSEPVSAFAARYPFNKVFKSESGHLLEIDDTPNKERIHQYHKSGTYTEINSEGRKVEKIVGDDYEIVVKNKTIYVRGNVNIKVDGNYTVESAGNMVFKAPKIDFNN